MKPVLKIGQLAPDFKANAVFNQEFVSVRLSKFRKKKYVILFFYPLDFTFVCPTEINAFSDKFKEFSKLNSEIFGVSVDSKFSHLAWLQSTRLNGGLDDLSYPLVSDLKKEISLKYNVLTNEGITLRALFIIDKNGIIQHSTINNLAFGRNIDETLRILQAIQCVQNNSNKICPANWKPGDLTIISNPIKLKDYFSSSN